MAAGSATLLANKLSSSSMGLIPNLRWRCVSCRKWYSSSSRPLPLVRTFLRHGSSRNEGVAAVSRGLGRVGGGGNFHSLRGIRVLCKTSSSQEYEVFEEEGEAIETIVMSSTPSYHLPSERDLIDELGVHDMDLDVSRLPSSSLPPMLPLPPHGYGSQTEIVPPTTSGPKKSKDKKKPMAPPLPLSSTVSPQHWKKAAKKTLTKDQREEAAKVRFDEMQALGKEVSMNKSLLAYLDMCVFTQELSRGLHTLNYYRNRYKSSSSQQFPRVSDVEAYNGLMSGYASTGNILRVREIFRMIGEEGLKPSPQSYMHLLECLGRNAKSKNNSHRIRLVLKQLEDDGLHIQDLFNKVIFENDQREVVTDTIRRVQPSFRPLITQPFLGYVCPLLTEMNQVPSGYQVISEGRGLITLEKLQEQAEKQFIAEIKGSVVVKSIENKDGMNNIDYFREVAANTEKSWAVAIEDALERNITTLLNQGKHRSQRTISLLPFLQVLPKEDYVRIVIQEIRKLAEGSETYSPGVSQLHRELGAAVLARYQVLHKKEKGILPKVQELYSDYLKWYLDPQSDLNDYGVTATNSRQRWQQLLFHPDVTGPHVDIAEKTWPTSVLSSIGRFLYGIIMRDIKVNVNAMKINSQTEQLVPAFYSIFRMQSMQLKEEVKPHPTLVKLLQAASRDELTFDATVLPMLSPPLPWASIRTGGYLLSPAKIIRLPHQAHQQKLRLEGSHSPDLYPALDSLNQLGTVPWIINQKMLDIVIEVFNKKGDEDLSIPPPPSECPPPPSIEPSMSRQEKYKVHKERAALKRRKGEMYSLWCDALYRLSLANHFRNDVFWFPHNMDFRGRVYPCPPHLNHLGADVARAILFFAQGKPLGKNGLKWLKLHLVNLTGLKKRDSIEDRLSFVDSVLEDIFDSADYPLTGKKWWAESEEPWQTLACCIEITNAIRSEDPASYVSHFPIHQDGSCNGLQHYAALGRDEAGAVSVNLAPMENPQDVYTEVAKLVEKLRAQDAENGMKVAQVLDGFIKRKVIKQTVMTTVYGVTRYGARLQIAKQLKDIPDFPKEFIWPGSIYLVGRTFDSIQEMFTSTKLIQDWFTECARQISQICGQNVEWVTPLGLPVVQPYYRPSKEKQGGSSSDLRVTDNHVYDLYERPNVMKQKNAFPPNFIHSLDSSHMMLTSLHCERKGITYVSVHDCFWTHPATVEIMNSVCREQFVTLHSQPILEDLSRFLVEKYSYRERELSSSDSAVDNSKRHLNAILKDVPHKGSFDLKNVLKSVFFFS